MINKIKRTIRNLLTPNKVIRKRIRELLPDYNKVITLHNQLYYEDKPRPTLIDDLDTMNKSQLLKTHHAMLMQLAIMKSAEWYEQMLEEEQALNSVWDEE